MAADLNLFSAETNQKFRATLIFWPLRQKQCERMHSLTVDCNGSFEIQDCAAISKEKCMYSLRCTPASCTALSRECPARAG